VLEPGDVLSVERVSSDCGVGAWWRVVCRTCQQWLWCWSRVTCCL